MMEDHKTMVKSYLQLREMCEGDSLDKCASKFLLMMTGDSDECVPQHNELTIIIYFSCL